MALRTYDAPPWGVRVVSRTKSRKIPTRKILSLFSERSCGVISGLNVGRFECEPTDNIGDNTVVVRAHRCPIRPILP